uniref:MHC class I-like antigen recognition-like domain-containing protein n=1 Tax=Canis lupus familiaris TaxID=9615 RepID=A0A8C0NM10_CANLF
MRPCHPLCSLHPRLFLAQLSCRALPYSLPTTFMSLLQYSVLSHLLPPLYPPPLPLCVSLPSNQTYIHSLQSPHLQLLHLLSWFPLISFHFFFSVSPIIHSLSCPDPFQVQVTLGCELHFGEPSVGFVRLAYQGEDLISFQNKSWWPSPKGRSRAQQVCRQVNELDHDDTELTHELITGHCPRFVLSLLDAGKADLQRQVRPEAWLSAGPSQVWPSAAGVPCLWLLPQACAGDVDAG